MSIALAGNASFRAPFGELPGPVRHLPYDDEAALGAIDARIAAVVIEPVQAEGGVRIPSQNFIAALRERCTATGALLVFDEVLTGLGRTGRLFALEHFGVVPDLMVLAKALGGGLPLGAFCGSDLLHLYRPGFDRLGGHAIRADSERILAANLHQGSHAIETAGYLFVVHFVG